MVSFPTALGGLLVRLDANGNPEIDGNSDLSGGAERLDRLDEAG